MTACHHARPSAYFPPNASSTAQWPDKMLRTYLWALDIETESCIPGNNSNTSRSCDLASFVTYSAPPSPSSSSFAQVNEMAHNPLSSDYCIYEVSSTDSQRPPLLALSRLRHSASCDINLRHSLPTSPRHPRLVPFRSLSPSPKAECPMKQPVLRSAGSLEASSRDARGRNVPLSRPPSLIISPSPTIILSPPTSPSPSRHSFASLLSTASASDYPSEPATSLYDDCESTSESSESAISDRLDEEQVEPTEGSSYARVLESFRKSMPEETDIPLQTVSESVFNHVTTSQPERKFVLLDASETRRVRSLMRPGAHGWVVPSTLSLTDILVHHARQSSGGCHLFIRRQTDSQARYQYFGFYRIVQQSVLGSETNEMKEGRPDDSSLFFLQFLRYDRELFSLMDRFTASKAQSFAALESNSKSDSPQRQLKRREKHQHIRIVNVGGVDFEMAPSPIAWDHGSFIL